MAVVEELHVGDIGTEFRITVKEDGAIIDLSSTVTRQVVFYKPDKTTLTKDAGLYTDGSDGILFLTTAAGDIDVVGVWSYQVVLTFPGGRKWSSNVLSFRVRPNLA